MAIASVGTLGTGTHSTSANSFTHVTATNALAAGDFALLAIVTDNIQTTTGNSSDHTGVSGGGTWEKLGEYTNGQSAAGAGVTTSLWLLQATGAVNIGTTITMSLSGAVVDKTSSAWKFTKGAGMRIRLSIPFTLNPVANAVNASNGFGSSALTSSPSTSAARLYFRAMGKEANSTTALTVSSGFTTITAQRSRNNAAAVLVRGEFRINTSTGETSNPTMAVLGDTAAVFAALEEYDPNPVITAQPTDQWVLDGEDAVFEVSATGATGYEWQEYTPGMGGGSAVHGAAITAVNTSATVASLSTAAYSQGAGDAIIVRVKWEGTATPPSSVTDTAGNTYVARTPRLNGTAGVIIFDCMNAAAHAANVITVTWPGNIASYISLAPVRFTITGSASFVAEAGAPNSGTGTAVATGSFAAGDFAGFVVGTVGTGAAGTPGSGWTEDVEHGAAVGAQAMYRVDSPGGNYQGLSTLASSSPWFAAAASYSVGGGGTWDTVVGGSGETTDTLTLAGVTSADNGRIFRVLVTNADGSVTSNTVTLTITDGKLTYRSEITGGISSAVDEAPVLAPDMGNGDLDLMIIGAGVISGAAPSISTPAGWNLPPNGSATNLPLAGVVNTTLKVFWRYATGPGSTVNVEAGAAGLWGWTRIVYRNPHPTDPIGEIELGHLAASLAHVLPSLDAGMTMGMYVAWVSQAIAQGGTVTPPMIRRVNDEAGGIVLGDEQIEDLGATGTRTIAVASSADTIYAAIELRSLISTDEELTAVGVDLDGGYAINSVVGATLSGGYGIDASVGTNLNGAYPINNVVGTSLDGAYPINSAVGVTLEGEYDIAGAVGVTLSGGYPINNAVGANLDGEYPIRNAVGADLDGTYPINAIVGITLEGEYGIAGVVGVDLEGEYAINSVVGSTLAGAYPINGTVGTSLDGAYAINSVVGVDLEGEYGIAGVVGITLPGAYEVRNTVGVDLEGEYSIFSLVGVELTGEYPISQLVGIDLEGGYGIAGVVGVNLEGGYPILNTVAVVLDGAYALRNVVGQDLGGGYPIDAVVGVTLSGGYEIAAPEGTVGVNLDGGYAINEAVGVSLDGEYPIASVVGVTLVGGYPINSVVGVDLEGGYGIAGVVGATLAGAYPINNVVGVTLSGGYEVRNSVGVNLDGAYPIDNVVGVTLDGEYLIEGPAGVVGVTLAGGYAINEVVGVNLGGDYEIRQSVGISLDGEYPIRNAVGVNLSGAYSITGRVGTVLTGAYAVNNTVGVSLDGGYAIQEPTTVVGVTLAGGYEVRMIVRRNLDGAYVVQAIQPVNPNSVFNFAEAIMDARRVMHDELSVDALYQDDTMGQPEAIRVRWHTKSILHGDLLDTGFAQTIESNDKLAFYPSDTPQITFRKGGTITIVAYGPDFKFVLCERQRMTGPLEHIWQVSIDK